MALTTDQEERILTLRARGKSYKAIAEEANVSKQTAVDVCAKYKERIASLHALELEELYERQHITSRERIEAHSNLMRRIREEIESRELTDIPTDKLIELYIKQASALKEEIIEPTVKSSREEERDRKEREYLDRLTSSN